MGFFKRSLSVISLLQFELLTLISFSVSPLHFETIVVAEILKKVAFDVVATAFANIVFPERHKFTLRNNDADWCSSLLNPTIYLIDSLFTIL